STRSHACLQGILSSDVYVLAASIDWTHFKRHPGKHHRANILTNVPARNEQILHQPRISSLEKTVANSKALFEKGQSRRSFTENRRIILVFPRRLTDQNKGHIVPRDRNSVQPAFEAVRLFSHCVDLWHDQMRCWQ
ncbi:hypothetical protein PgNI_05886, partial [Pyricularia grisea]|uniref:Uncharacterized protein n=1 Tax=Pyricularia grisea TaxID=148305 RepID=A0A6P8B6V3_PYRGI